MINIKEDTPNKISGITSLFVSFAFNQEIVNTIKRASKYVYDKSTHSWELPINCLAYLLDNLTFLDDITLELKAENANKPHFIPKSQYKSKPFQHQLEAVEYGLNKEDGSWLLLDQPGLGKSASMIYLAQELKEQRGLEHCLIICGVNTLKSNWRKEINIHSNLTCRIIGERKTKSGKIYAASIKERAAEIMQPIDAFFLIINIESIRNDDVVQALKNTKNKIDMIVVDEIHRCLVYDSLIKTDLGELKIGDIVENKIKCKVLSVNIKNNQLYYKNIKDYKKIYGDGELVKLTVLENGVEKVLTCSPDHKIYTHNRGFVEAAYLEDTDDIASIDSFS